MINQSEIKLFNLNGINIECNFQYAWSNIQSLNHLVSHVEFKSLKNNKSNDISDTGYRSEWIMNEQHEDFENLNDLIRQYINCRSIRIYNLDYQKMKEKEEFVQLSLF